MIYFVDNLCITYFLVVHLEYMNVRQKWVCVHLKNNSLLKKERIYE